MLLCVLLFVFAPLPPPCVEVAVGQTSMQTLPSVPEWKMPLHSSLDTEFVFLFTYCFY